MAQSLNRTVNLPMRQRTGQIAEKTNQRANQGIAQRFRQWVRKRVSQFLNRRVAHLIVFIALRAYRLIRFTFLPFKNPIPPLPFLPFWRPYRVYQVNLRTYRFFASHRSSRQSIPVSGNNAIEKSITAAPRASISDRMEQRLRESIKDTSDESTYQLTNQRIAEPT